MRVEDVVASGRAALAAGRWTDAQAAFTAALGLAAHHAEALDGLGEALWWLGDPQKSNQLRERAYVQFRRVGDAAAAIVAALGVAVTYEANFDNGPAARGWVARAGRLLTGDHDPLAPSVWAIRAYITDDLPLAIKTYERTLAAARAAGDTDLELVCLSGLGQKLVKSGQVADGLALIDEAMAATLGGECTRLETVVYTSCDMLVACDLAHDLDRATRWCQIADGFIRDFGCPFLYARCRTIYGGLLVATGRWAEGEQELSAAMAMSTGAGPAVAADAHARMASLRLRQGRVDEAASILHHHEEQTRALFTAAAVRLARGDTTGAVTLLQRRLTRPVDGAVGSAPALALLVRASLDLGDVTAAREAGDRLTRLAKDQRCAHTDALAAAAMGHVHLALDDPAGADAQWEIALGLFVELGMPYDAARVRLDLARLHAPHRPDVAIDEAATALETFDRIGAVLDASAAAAVLRLLGAPPTPTRGSAGELTGRERQVLGYVSQGLSNPEIAARLHISRKTVAHHVSSVLTKLGLRNRTEAAAHLGRDR